MIELPLFRAFPDGSWSVAETSADLLRQLLSALEEEMAAAGWTGDAGLLPGRDRSDIVRLLRANQLEASEELVALYEWHDGSVMAPGASTLPTLRLEPLELALARQPAVADPDDPDDWWWRDGWMPLEGDIRGNVIYCNLPPEEPPLVAFVDESNPLVGERRRPVLRSLCTTFTIEISLMRAGAVTWEGGRWLADRRRIPEDLQRFFAM